MKIATVFSLLGLLAPITFAAPSLHQQKVFSDKRIGASSSQVDCLHKEPLDVDAGIIPDGDYSITSPCLTPGFGIGRWAEDFSLAPKRIKTEPYAQNGGSDVAYWSRWTIKYIANGRFQLISGREQTVSFDNSIWALLVPQQVDIDSWLLVPQGYGAFTIEDGRGNAWTAGREPDSQVLLRPKISGPIDAQLFFLTPRQSTFDVSPGTTKNTSAVKVSAVNLPEGVYSITSPALDHGFGIGRWIEDLSPLPKKIKTEPYEDRAGQFDPEWSRFTLRFRDDETAELSIGGANTGLVQGSIWAIIEPGFMPAERDTWIINGHGDDVFTIEDGNGKAWTVDPKVDAQVTLAPLDGSSRQLFIFQFISPINSQRALTAGSPTTPQKLLMPTSPTNAMSGLISGTYIISSPMLRYDLAIGRFFPQPGDLQKITTSTRDIAHPWNLEALGNDEYILSSYDNNGISYPSVSLDDSVFVPSPNSDGPPPTKWVIRPDDFGFSGLYSITDDSGLEWTAGRTPGDQVRLTPPLSPSGVQLFSFTRLLSYDQADAKAAITGPPSNIYTISSPWLDSNLAIGTFVDGSPEEEAQRITTSPQDIAGKWDVQLLENGKYRLSLHYDNRRPYPTVVMGGNLWALNPFYGHGPQYNEWILSAVDKEARLYSIGDGEGNVWTATSFASAQVKLLPPGPPSPLNIQLFSLKAVGSDNVNAHAKAHAEDGPKATKLDIKLSVQEF